MSTDPNDSAGIAPDEPENIALAMAASRMAAATNECEDAAGELRRLCGAAHRQIRELKRQLDEALADAANARANLRHADRKIDELQTFIRQIK